MKFKQSVHADPDNESAHTALGDVRFDPRIHLTDFARLEGQQLEFQLKPFRLSGDAWMPPEDLESIRRRWDPVRDSLMEEMEAHTSSLNSSDSETHSETQQPKQLEEEWGGEARQELAECHREMQSVETALLNSLVPREHEWYKPV